MFVVLRLTKVHNGWQVFYGYPRREMIALGSSSSPFPFAWEGIAHPPKPASSSITARSYTWSWDPVLSELNLGLGLLPRGSQALLGFRIPPSQLFQVPVTSWPDHNSLLHADVFPLASCDSWEVRGDAKGVAGDQGQVNVYRQRGSQKHVVSID